MADSVLGLEGFSDAVQVGHGGYGVVYRAVQDDLHRAIAVKILSGGPVDGGARRRFERERLAMGALSGHPAIVTVHETGFNDAGRPYIVMEYMANGSLADLLAAEGPMSWQEAVAVGVRIASGLEAAHAAGLLHRDVKPENLLVSEFDEVKLSDFGIASLTEGSMSATHTVTASVAHAGPEILEGKRPSAASDVYSLASTVFALITGRAAFRHETDESVVPMLTRVLTAPVPNLRPRGVPDSIALVLERAMAKDPDERYQTAHEFREALTAAAHTEGLSLPTLGAAAAFGATVVDLPAVATVYDSPAGATVQESPAGATVQESPAAATVHEPAPPVTPATVHDAATPVSSATVHEPATPATVHDAAPVVAAGAAAAVGSDAAAAADASPASAVARPGSETTHEPAPPAPPATPLGYPEPDEPSGSSGRRRGLVVAAIVAAVILLGGGLAFALNSGSGTDDKRSGQEGGGGGGEPGTLDNLPPSLIITAPADGGVAAQSALKVVGTVNEDSTISLDGPLSRGAFEAKADTQWTYDVNLVPGANLLRFTAKDAAGNRDSKQINVIYYPPAGAGPQGPGTSTTKPSTGGGGTATTQPTVPTTQPPPPPVPGPTISGISGPSAVCAGNSGSFSVSVSNAPQGVSWSSGASGTSVSIFFPNNSGALQWNVAVSAVAHGNGTASASKTVTVYAPGVNGC